MRARLCLVLVLSTISLARAKLDTEEEEDSGDQNWDSDEDNVNRTQKGTTRINRQYNESTSASQEETTVEKKRRKKLNNKLDGVDSSENLGASVSQIYRHPYAASLLKHDLYICSAVILNTFWALTQTKCFDSDIISSYVTQKNLGNYSVRVGSSYNNKGGTVIKIKSLINNFDLKVSTMKLERALEFSSHVRSVRLPRPDDDATIGFLATILAWTPAGHMRLVNAPVIDSSICDGYSKLLPGHYICMGGVQDPNRNFCRRDNGGAIIQNNTLIALSSFRHTCALYTRSHAFPKVSSFARWLDSVIWDEENRPSTGRPSTPSPNTSIPNTTETTTEPTFFQDPRKFMLTLPFDPINVPLEPAEDNSVIPRMSLYESYLQNIARSKTSTTLDPVAIEERRQDWIKKFGKSGLMMPPGLLKEKTEFDYK